MFFFLLLREKNKGKRAHRVCSRVEKGEKKKNLLIFTKRNRKDKLELTEMGYLTRVWEQGKSVTQRE